MPQCDHIAETEPAVTGAPDAAARAEMRAKRVEDALAAGLSHTVSLTLGYEGSGFAGYARQAETHIKTVQGELESVLSMLYKRDVPIVCAGRTDAGVHARGQIVSFDVSEDEFQSRSFRGLQRSLNALVDEAISISSIDERPLGFPLDLTRCGANTTITFARTRPVRCSLRLSRGIWVARRLMSMR